MWVRMNEMEREGYLVRVICVGQSQSPGLTGLTPQLAHVRPPLPFPT